MAATLEINTPPVQPPIPQLSALAGFVRERFDKARIARTEVERRMLDNIRQKQSQYTTSKLAAIREVMGKAAEPPFIGITEAKCDAIYAWLIDAILPPGQTPFSLEPTPVPELPAAMMAELEADVQEELFRRVEQLAMSGTFVNAQTIRTSLELLREEVKDRLDKEVLEHAREAAAKMQTKIKDQFAEGGYENVLRMSLHDLVDVGTAIMRGPVLRSRPVRKRSLDPASRRFTTTYEQEVLCEWERLVPLRFYPSPDATRESLPWYVYVNSTSRRDLAGLLDVEGYDQTAVRQALIDYHNGLREHTYVEEEKAQLEGRVNNSSSELIDRLEYGGSVPGWMLQEWGVTEGQYLDPQREYDALVWVVGSHVIKALINPDPVGLNYIFSAGFSERPDSFWGIGVPEKMKHSQTIANVAARAIVMNVGIASGPMTEVNVDRMWPGENYTITPWKVIKSTNAMMAEGKAANFYQPNMVTQRLIEVFNFCLALADHETGIPKMLYSGESSVPTASATSMLMTQASKGGQNIIRNVDVGLIVPAVVAQYNFNLQYEGDDDELFGDLKVVARGSNSLIVREQKVMRLKEILRDANNPTDLQIFTVPVRAKLWKEAMDALGIDPRVMGEEDEIEERAMEIQQQQQMAMMGGTMRDPEAAAELDGAGQPVAGRDNQLFESGEGSQP